MKAKILVITFLMICMSCIEHHTSIDDSVHIDVTIASLDSICSFSMPSNKTLFVMIQKRDEVAKVYSYNLNKKEKDSTEKLITTVYDLECKKNSEGLTRKDDFCIILQNSENSEKQYYLNCKNQIPIASLRNYLFEIYHNSKKHLVFQSASELVLPPPPPLPEISLDSVKFFKNDK
ncbi:hypothetical protein J2X31_002933 [Flavobacterium arsenatis]|uniref:Lipoprotein n=1 Tax=Flavobacterium arsenatis TaxID=1484332 RepID=A0ABU1TST4_9FLAO|nr:hypothetical protein [Flavobacterium arsenatis]MDR6968907.1 hypothetical protein [Flavobacterium arsenatis]